MFQTLLLYCFFFFYQSSLLSKNSQESLLYLSVCHPVLIPVLSEPGLGLVEAKWWNVWTTNNTASNRGKRHPASDGEIRAGYFTCVRSWRCWRVCGKPLSRWDRRTGSLRPQGGLLAGRGRCWTAAAAAAADETGCSPTQSSETSPSWSRRGTAVVDKSLTRGLTVQTS